MNASAMMLVIDRGGPYGAAMTAAVLARDAAYRVCRNPALRHVAAALDDFEGRMWNRGDDAGKQVALTATLVAALVLDSPRLTADEIGRAPEKLIRALDAAAENKKGYNREHYKQKLAVYRALYNGLYAHSGDMHAREAAQGLLQMTDNEDPSCAIESLKRAIALLVPKGAA
jgi:hypothetical protein